MSVIEDRATRHSLELFDLTGRIAIITGGAGLMGEQHAAAIAGAGGIPILVDINGGSAQEKAQGIGKRFGVKAMAYETDVTQAAQIRQMHKSVLEHFGHVDILINNAANNPKVEDRSDTNFARLENFPPEQWEDDLAVGLTGAFLCSQIIGSEMAARKQGVILNIASDLSVIAPDQRLYRNPGLAEEQQPVKPVTYSVVKSGLVGLTRYLATYWADRGVRVNAVSPGGVYNSQPEEFVARLSRLIPMGRMANTNEWQGAVLFLCSDASSYITGINVVIDGGRSCW